MPSRFQPATAAQLANYDQCLAENVQNLEELTAIWCTSNLDEPEHYALAGLAKSLYYNIDAESLAELLAVAIWKYGGPRLSGE